MNNRAWIKVGTHPPSRYVIDLRTVTGREYLPNVGSTMQIREDKPGAKKFRVTVEQIDYTGRGLVLFVSKV